MMKSRQAVEIRQSSDWQNTQLGNIAYFEMGQSPSSTYVSEEEIGIPFLQGNADFGLISPTPQYYCSQPKKLCKPGDVLISVRAPVGDLNKADQIYVIGRGLAAVRFTDISSDFGWHLLHYWAKDLKRVAQGTTFKAISKGDLDALQVWLPPLAEQHRIAEILDAADAAIRETERVIAKLREVKRGLLHDLLTRGLDARGRLRDPDAHPEQFKDSPLGRIPRVWETPQLSEVIRVIDCKHYTPDYIPSGIPIVRPRNVRTSGLDFSDIDFISEEEYRLLVEKHEPRYGDIVFSRNASFGVPCYVDIHQNFAIGQDVVIMTSDTTNTRFVFYTLLSEIIEKQIQRLSSGSTFGRINLRSIRTLRIPFPAFREQKRITTVLDTHDARIHAEEAELAKRRQVKRGLMDDLLMGKVRV